MNKIKIYIYTDFGTGPRQTGYFIATWKDAIKILSNLAENQTWSTRNHTGKKYRKSNFYR